MVTLNYPFLYESVKMSLIIKNLLGLSWTSMVLIWGFLLSGLLLIVFSARAWWRWISSKMFSEGRLCLISNRCIHLSRAERERGRKTWITIVSLQCISIVDYRSASNKRPLRISAPPYRIPGASRLNFDGDARLDFPSSKILKIIVYWVWKFTRCSWLMLNSCYFLALKDFRPFFSIF